MTTDTDTAPELKLPKGAKEFSAVLGVFVDAQGVPVPEKAGRKGRSIDRKDFRLDTRSVFEKDPHLLGEGAVHRDEHGFLVQNAGQKELPIDPRKTFRRGTRWRVVGANVRIEAMCYYGTSANGSELWSGWSQHLPEGTIVECLGWRRFRKDGLVAPQFTYAGLPPEAKYSAIWPTDGVWRPWPLMSILEAVTD